MKRSYAHSLMASLCVAALALAACHDHPSATPPSSLSYPSPQTDVVGTATAVLTPSVTGTVIRYSVSPALPAGLTLNASTGHVSGTPSAPAHQANYTVTAQNKAGSTTFSLTLTVSPAPNTVAVSLDGSLSAVNANVASYVSLVDSQPPGSALQLPDPGSGFSTMVLALDANGNILAAGYPDSSAGSWLTLTSSSSALILTRIILGTLPAATSESVLNSAIEAAPSFPDLVTLVGQAQTNGTPPQQTSTLIATVSTVLSQVTSGITTTATVRASAKNTGPVTLPGPTVPLPLPYILFGPANSSTAGTLSIQGATADNGVQLLNRIPLMWSASTADLYGNAIKANVTLNAASALQIFATLPDPQDVPAAGTAFQLTVAQTAETRKANLIRSILDVVGIGSDFAAEVIAGGDSGCIDSAVGLLLSGDHVPDYLSSGSLSDLQAALGSIFSTSNLPALASATQSLVTCFEPSLATNLVNKLNPKALGAIGKLLILAAEAPVGEILEAANVATAALDMAALGSYAQASTTVVVCESQEISGWTVVNCPVGYSIRPTNPSVQVGSTVVFNVTAVDAQGHATAVPKDMVWSTSNSGVATVDLYGTVTAVAAGTADITVTDSATGYFAKATVTVTTMSPPPPPGITTVTITGTVDTTTSISDTDYDGVFVQLKTPPCPFNVCYTSGNLAGLPFKAVFKIDSSKGSQTDLYYGPGNSLSSSQIADVSGQSSPITATLTINNVTVDFNCDISQTYVNGSDAYVSTSGGGEIVGYNKSCSFTNGTISFYITNPAPFTVDSNWQSPGTFTVPSTASVTAGFTYHTQQPNQSPISAEALLVPTTIAVSESVQ